ncbi:MAG: glycosyltransferase family 2 protein [Actinobacteria bacterium]|nr:glycosyltransferase family 2 protein [Actinomycetota bacterium]
MSAAPDVSVVLPVYNEAGHLRDEVDRIRRSLDASEFSYELIVIDDGSTDGSGEVAAGIEGIRLLRFRDNRGSGSVRRIGTRAARAPVVVWTDADMTYPNDRIPELVRSLEGYDQVVGARTTEEGSHRFLRKPAKWIIRRIAIMLSRTDIPDLNSGFRAFRKDVAEQFLHLLPEGFSCVTTITLSFLTSGYSVNYVPIEYAERAGRSKFHWYQDSKRYLMQVVRMILMFEPLRVLGPLGLGLLTLGVGKVVYDVIAHPLRIAGNTQLILLAALITILIALLSDLVVRLTRPRLEVMPVAQVERDPATDRAASAAER